MVKVWDSVMKSSAGKIGQLGLKIPESPGRCISLKRMGADVHCFSVPDKHIHPPEIAIRIMIIGKRHSA